MQLEQLPESLPAAQHLRDRQLRPAATALAPLPAAAGVNLDAASRELGELLLQAGRLRGWAQAEGGGDTTATANANRAAPSSAAAAAAPAAAMAAAAAGAWSLRQQLAAAGSTLLSTEYGASLQPVMLNSAQAAAWALGGGAASASASASTKTAAYDSHTISSGAATAAAGAAVAAGGSTTPSELRALFAGSAAREDMGWTGGDDGAGAGGGGDVDIDSDDERKGRGKKVCSPQVEEINQQLHSQSKSCT